MGSDGDQHRQHAASNHPYGWCHWTITRATLAVDFRTVDRRDDARSRRVHSAIRLRGALPRQSSKMEKGLQRLLRYPAARLFRTRRPQITTRSWGKGDWAEPVGIRRPTAARFCPGAAASCRPVPPLINSSIDLSGIRLTSIRNGRSDGHRNDRRTYRVAPRRSGRPWREHRPWAGRRRIRRLRCRGPAAAQYG